MLIYIGIYYKYVEIHHKCTTSTLKYTINIQYRYLNKFKCTQILSNTLKYIEMSMSALNYIGNTPKCSGKRFKYFGVF
jgi:hypothetical protein